MRKKIDYKPLCLKAMKFLESVNGLAKEFSKFELSKPARIEIDEIKELSGKQRELKEPYKELFSKTMEDVCRIADDLHEINMVASDLIKRANELPKEARDEWFKRTGMIDIPKEFQGLGEYLEDRLNEMLELVSDILDDTHKYYSLEKEDYVEYEDEIE